MQNIENQYLFCHVSDGIIAGESNSHCKSTNKRAHKNLLQTRL